MIHFEGGEAAGDKAASGGGGGLVSSISKLKKFNPLTVGPAP